MTSNAGPTVVMGAGIVGVTTAYYLAKSGRKVIVLDRRNDVAQETSFANAGLVAPGHSYTWASPRAPKILLKSLFVPGQALRLRLRADPLMWAWCWKFLRNCTSARSIANTQRKVRLCIYSQAELMRLVQEERIEYDGIDKGLVYVYRDDEAFERGARVADVLRQEGLKLTAIDAKTLREIEPAFQTSTARIAGALYSPGDASGDSRKFTSGLAERCRAMGVEFRLGSDILGVEVEGDRIRAVKTDAGAVSGSAFVLALGVFSAGLARSFGYRLPIYPVKGYSLTLPVSARNVTPSVGGVDEAKLVAWARMGDRFRVTGTAEFAGYDVSHKEADFTDLVDTARELFPQAADFGSPSYWSCLRPMTPEGTPILGRTVHRNLFLNTGHGHMGWTMACGTARMVVDVMDGRQPEIPIESFSCAEVMTNERSGGLHTNFLHP